MPPPPFTAVLIGLVSAATSTSPGMGLLLDDRYRVEELIARGGMATVHRGHDQRLDRVVALKIMHPHLATDEDFRTWRRTRTSAGASVARPAARHVSPTATSSVSSTRERTPTASTWPWSSSRAGLCGPASASSRDSPCARCSM